MAATEVHMSTYNSGNGSKRKNQGNGIGNTQSNDEPKNDQQGKEKCAWMKDLMQAKSLNYDQMGHPLDCTEPKKILSNIF